MSRGRFLAHLFLCAFLITTTAFASDPTFSVKSIPAAGVRDLHFGDFDGDGATDLAALTDAGIAVFFNDAQANFTRIDLPVAQPMALQVADFNGDGRMDLAVASNHQIFIFLNHGDRTFQALPPLAPPNWQGSAFGAVDLNGDRHADLVLSLKTNVVSVLPGNGDGTFQAPVDVYTVVAPASATDPSLYALRGPFLNGDFNGDGRQDIVFAEGPLSVPFGGVNVTVLLNQGNLQFTRTQFSEGDFTGASVLDANGDHVDDIGFGWSACHTPCAGADVWAGSASGTMTPLLIASTNTTLQSLAVSPVAADFNGDGKPDVAFSMGHNEGSTFPAVTPHQSVLIYAGPLTFTQGVQPPAPVDINLGPVSSSQFLLETPAMVSADFNLDGKPDIAVIANDESAILLVLNTTATGTFPAPARDFTLSLSPGAATVKAGAGATATLGIARFGAFNDSVTFSCSGLPANAACVFSPATVTPGSDGHASASLTISTKAASTGSLRPLWPGMTTFAFAIPVFGTVLAGLGRRRAGVLLLLVVLLLLTANCGGNAAPASSTSPPPSAGPVPPPAPAPTPGTPAGTYTVTITATSGGTPAVVHTQNLSLTVQ